MEKERIPIVKRSLFSWVLPGNGKLQVALVLLIAVTVFARVIPLEMQKRIVNEAIKLRKMDLLLIYCGIYLVSVLLASGLKYMITIIQTRISENVLANMRKDLFAHILSLPLNFYRKAQPGMVVSALVTELTSAGSFVGLAISAPVINIMTLLAFAGYLIYLNPILAIISLALYPIILIIIPILQRGANTANKQRVDSTRTISSLIGEAISGIHEIQGNGTFRMENRRFGKIVDQMLKIRIIWTLYKQGVKVTNNFFVSLGPFVIFILGGYLAMQGQLELGAMVAFLSAQEKLYDPWKELIEFYQVYMDAAVSYKRTMEYFDTPTEFAIEPEDRQPFQLAGSIDIKELSYVTDTGIQLLDNINLSMNPGETLALVGFSGSGKSTLALCIGQLYKYSGGHILLGEKEVADLTKKDLIINMGFVSQSPFIFSGSIEENLVYSYAAVHDGEMDTDLLSLDDKIAVLHQTGIFVDVLRFGLNTILDRGSQGDLAKQLIRVRENFQREYGEKLSDYVEFFDENKYLYFSSVAENLFLGTPNDGSFSENNLPQNHYFLELLSKADLTTPLLSLGAELSRQTVDILGNLTPDPVFFEQSPISLEEWDEAILLVERLKRTRLLQLSDTDRDYLLKLALRFKPGKHNLVALPTILENLILEGRTLIRKNITQNKPDAFSFYQMSDYIYNQTIMNNILFGQTKTSNPKALDMINQSIIQLVIEEDFLETIVEIGMQFQVGSKGDKLSGGQRQKLAIARTFLKSPRMMIMDEATSALDNKSQTRIQNLLETRWKGKTTLISVVHRLDIIRNYDKVAVMKAGKIIEMGSYDELISKKGALYELVGGKK
ncbi:MAG: ABC transporter ATP-binding protein/permease [Deltaproteobacteria bacterium]|nr:ABC transporter ATP-binding protein/permease [Deltaproteobacteria bacterium]